VRQHKRKKKKRVAGGLGVADYTKMPGKPTNMSTQQGTVVNSPNANAMNYNYMSGIC